MVSPQATADRGRLRELTAEGWFRLALLVLGSCWWRRPRWWCWPCWPATGRR